MPRAMCVRILLFMHPRSRKCNRLQTLSALMDDQVLSCLTSIVSERTIVTCNFLLYYKNIIGEKVKNKIMIHVALVVLLAFIGYNLK